jgi:hypothetical protein
MMQRRNQEKGAEGKEGSEKIVKIFAAVNIGAKRGELVRQKSHFLSPI